MAKLIRRADVEALRDKAREAQQTADRAWMVEGQMYANTQELRDDRDRAERKWSDQWKAWKAQEADWSTAPSEARWYGEVTIDNGDETTDVSGYSGAEFEPDPAGLVAEGVKILGSTVKPTPGNEAWEGPENDDADGPGDPWATLEPDTD